MTELKPSMPPSFWKRLEMFVNNVQVNDPMSEEEKEMILHTCKKQLNLLSLIAIVLLGTIAFAEYAR